MKTTLTVFFKEVKENLRDRRTVLSALIFGPLLGPFVFMLITNSLLTRELNKADQPIRVPVIGAQHAPNLIAALKQDGLVPLPPVADPETAVRNRDADAVLRIPEGFGKSWRKGETSQVELIFDSSQSDTGGSVGRLRSMLENYSRRQGVMRLVARGLSPTMMAPISIDQRDQSTPQSRASLIFGLLPYFFVLTVFVGGMSLANDLTAGERERQSLEPLFANPVSRWKILAGKLAAICTFSCVSLLITLAAFAVLGPFVPVDKLGMELDLGLRFAGTVFLLMLPLVMLTAALQTLVAAFAKSYREAQMYVSLLMFVPIVPSLLMSVFPIKAKAWMYAVPLLGQHLGVMGALRGDGVAAQQVLYCLGGTLATALVATLITARLYRSERLAISG